MRLRTVHKVYKTAESRQLGRMSPEDYDTIIKDEISQSIAKVIFEKGKVPIIKRDSISDPLLNGQREEPFFQYESEFILLTRMEFEIIVEALRTIKNTL